MRPRFLPFVFLLGCGASIETKPIDPTPESPAPAAGPSRATPNGGGTSKPDPAPLAPCGPGASVPCPEVATPPVGAVDVTLTNATDHDVFVVIDAQNTPLWLEIDQPSLPLNGYGQQWCSGPAGVHNDPAFRTQTIAAGSALTYGWHGTFTAFKFNCWYFERAAAGPHAARACVYDVKPATLVTEPSSGGSSKSRPPSEWFTDKPSRCVDFTFELPAPGVTTQVAVAL